MKGTGLIYKPGRSLPERLHFAASPQLDAFTDALDGGYLELVPGFISIEAAGIPRRRLRCVAFCDEHGKLNHLPFNEYATRLWEDALAVQGESLYQGGALVDYLVGPVLVLFGDDEFMEAL